jgi:hypothetical protein
LNQVLTVFVEHDALAAALRRHSWHRQSSPLTGIGSTAVSAAHQHCPDSAQENFVPHPEQAMRRTAGPTSSGVSNQFVMQRTKV